MPSGDVPEQIREDQGAYWNENEPDTPNGRSASQHSFRDSIYSRTDADGSKQYLMVSGDAMFDSTGHFTGYSGTGKDVTKIIHHA